MAASGVSLRSPQTSTLRRVPSLAERRGRPEACGGRLGGPLAEGVEAVAGPLGLVDGGEPWLVGGAAGEGQQLRLEVGGESIDAQTVAAGVGDREGCPFGRGDGGAGVVDGDRRHAGRVGVDLDGWVRVPRLSHPTRMPRWSGRVEVTPFQLAPVCWVNAWRRSANDAGARSVGAASTSCTPTRSGSAPAITSHELRQLPAVSRGVPVCGWALQVLQIPRHHRQHPNHHLAVSTDGNQPEWVLRPGQPTSEEPRATRQSRTGTQSGQAAATHRSKG